MGLPSSLEFRRLSSKDRPVTSSSRVGADQVDQLAALAELGVDWVR
ncbi:hypothetical protein [Streptomyces sp. NBC_01565]|nr:hypothetical protein [Streptomyces sp. NBC_01565]MCX4539078.1 hypothetical protein [Streptomyces sp. NBC_01565]